MLREAVNIAKIDGILSEIKLEERQQTNGKTYIAGELLIEVADNNIVPVSVFSYSTVKDTGAPNKVYEHLKSIANTYKSIAANGRENADAVRVSRGQLSTNEFFNQEDRLISYFRVRSSFLNRADRGAGFEPKATFEVEGYIAKILPEIKGDEETGNLIITLIIPGWQGSISIQNFIVKKDDPPKAVQFVNKHYEVGQTVKLFGDIINTVTYEDRVNEVAFGEPTIEKQARYSRELHVKGGTEPYDEDMAFVTADIKDALRVRDRKLEEEKNKAKNKKAAPPKNDNAFEF